MIKNFHKLACKNKDASITSGSNLERLSFIKNPAELKFLSQLALVAGIERIFFAIFDKLIKRDC